MHDERIAMEEGTEEVITKKIKTETTSTLCIEPPVAGESSPSIMREEKTLITTVVKVDFAKKKLDSMFNRQIANKKKFPIKPVNVTSLDTYNDIDKLMTQYGGKIPKAFK